MSSLFSMWVPSPGSFSRMKIRNKTIFLTQFALVLAFCTVCTSSLAACSRTSCRVQGIGTMRCLGMEGGFYGIEADSGAHYRPVNLPKEFAKEGLRIRFCAEPLEGVMSIHMWGIPVEIAEMEHLKPEPRNH